MEVLHHKHYRNFYRQFILISPQILHTLPPHSVIPSNPSVFETLNVQKTHKHKKMVTHGRKKANEKPNKLFPNMTSGCQETQ